MLTRRYILKLFDALNLRLEKISIQGELHIVGGAVMCLVYNARESTFYVDGLFKPAKELRAQAAKLGVEFGIGENWLNDGVKGFFSGDPTFESFLQLSHLKVYTASPEYLLAMKCLAMRIGEEFHDISDIRYLIRYLNLESYEEASAVIARYYPLSRFPQKTLYALQELLEE